MGEYETVKFGIGCRMRLTVFLTLLVVSVAISKLARLAAADALTAVLKSSVYPVRAGFPTGLPFLLSLRHGISAVRR